MRQCDFCRQFNNIVNIQYYSLHRHHRPGRDYLFRYISEIARLGHYSASVDNSLIFSKRLVDYENMFLGYQKIVNY